MKIWSLLVSAAVTIGIVMVLNSTLLLPAPLGALLSPQHGIWQNAENAAADFNFNQNFPQLKGKVNVYVDERLVPHVFAEVENDVYFVQGYLHAKFRLWQMELQTHAAAGRASEIIGEKALSHDREFRRLGMGYAAEISLIEMEKDSITKASCDAYTAGVNAYIHNLTQSELPIEYKLIGYQPEPWTNLKTALFLKYMSYDLSAHEDDIEMTNAKAYFSAADFELLYPLKQDSLDPIIPKGTLYPAAKLLLKIPAKADSVYFKNKHLVVVKEEKPDRENGSNNWAVSGKKTKSGAPILCNDPHLGLNLPSLWFEMQLSTPSFNAYGASFPGSPSVIIGFNDSCAFGVTNGGRDVRDYYEIKFKDDSRSEYWFDSAWKKTEFRIETIKVKGAENYLDTVAYTVFGPVMYDKSFSGNNRIPNNKYYAVKWTAHDASNELLTFNLLNHAKNYNDYLVAVKNMHTPGQNFAFAAKNGDIAMRTEGAWPAKWKGQGDFIMPGTDSSYLWQATIPENETPFQFNPERGFISSANQKPADSTYPYYLGRNYPQYRGLLINRKLTAMNAITPQDMMALQTNNYDVFAAMAMPIFIKNIRQSSLGAEEQKYLSQLTAWNFNNEIAAAGPTIFSVLWTSFESVVYDDDFKNAPAVIKRPFESSLLEGILRDSNYRFLNNIETQKKENLADDVTAAFKIAVLQIKNIDKDGRLPWGKFKATRINHLSKILTPFSRFNIPIGGGSRSINATKEDHGPSWRMIVSLTPQTEAYGVYPGGQSGNPGSKYYDNFINQWAAGKYYPLWVMKATEQKDNRVKWVMNFTKG